MAIDIFFFETRYLAYNLKFHTCYSLKNAFAEIREQLQFFPLENVLSCVVSFYIICSSSAQLYTLCLSLLLSTFLCFSYHLFAFPSSSQMCLYPVPISSKEKSLSKTKRNISTEVSCIFRCIQSKTESMALCMDSVSSCIVRLVHCLSVRLGSCDCRDFLYDLNMIMSYSNMPLSSLSYELLTSYSYFRN